MPSNKKRMGRINEEVLRELSTALRTVKDPRLSSLMISVVRCEVTNDLRWCRASLSILGDYDEKEVKKGLASCSGYLRQELARSLGLRYTPELVFSLDNSIAHGAHISQVLRELDVPHDTEVEDDI